MLDPLRYLALVATQLAGPLLNNGCINLHGHKTFIPRSLSGDKAPVDINRFITAYEHAKTLGKGSVHTELRVLTYILALDVYRDKWLARYTPKFMALAEETNDKQALYTYFAKFLIQFGCDDYPDTTSIFDNMVDVSVVEYRKGMGKQELKKALDKALSLAIEHPLQSPVVIYADCLDDVFKLRR